MVLHENGEASQKKLEQPAAQRPSQCTKPACSRWRNGGVIHGIMVLYSRSVKKNAAGLLTFPGFCRPSHPDVSGTVTLSANHFMSLAAKAGLQQRVLFRTFTGFPFKPVMSSCRAPHVSVIITKKEKSHQAGRWIFSQKREGNRQEYSGWHRHPANR